MTYRLIRLPDGPLNEKALEAAHEAYRAEDLKMRDDHELEDVTSYERGLLRAAIRAFLDAMP